MLISRVKIFGLFGLFLSISLPLHAQSSGDGGREASFLPLSQASPSPVNPASLVPVQTQPIAPPPSNTSVQVFNGPQPQPTQPIGLPTVVLGTTQAPVGAPLPMVQVPTEPLAPLPLGSSSAQAPNPLPSPIVIAPPAALGAVGTQTQNPYQPVALPKATDTKSIESGALSTIDPESIGLLSPQEGGLGAALWKGTNRGLVERLLPSMTLPLFSSTLNKLAERFLLTTASVPEGPKGDGESLSSMRIEKLLMLGDSLNAWKLALLTKPEQLDEITLRLVAEAALLSSERDSVCSKIPDIIKTHTGVEWQKLLLVCQLRSGDTKAAQLTLDLLHAQNVKDDVYFFVAEKNIIAGSKQLPRQLTPLKPLTLALLRLTNLPLPSEIYVHPEASLIPELLEAPAREEAAPLGLAERAAERGLISEEGLATTYKKLNFAPEILTSAANSPESGPRLHALLYQAALQEKLPQNRIGDAFKFIQTASPALLNGAGGQVVAEMVNGISPSPDYNASSALMARIDILAGKPDAALEWIKIARHASIGLPNVGVELTSLWPLTVYAGLESDNEYSQDLTKWLESTLKRADPKADNHLAEEQAASILLLLDATGFAVSEDAWGKVADVPVFERHVMPPAFLLERLRASAVANHKGEAVLLSLLLASGNGSDVPLLATIEIVRALRLVGLTADAASLARETAVFILTPPQPKP